MEVSLIDLDLVLPAAPSGKADEKISLQGRAGGSPEPNIRRLPNGSSDPPGRPYPAQPVCHLCDSP